MTPASCFHKTAPAFLEELSAAPEMRRLRAVGMNCGCEYTAFPLFRSLGPYSRFDHSLGTARIVWDFTGDAAQTIAALFHDIATPTFAHSVDFLHGDHLRQESTEAETERIIRSSGVIVGALARIGVSLDEVVDYHRYPIADNDSPRLSADRLEYTLGNLRNFGFCTEGQLRRYYGDLIVVENEEGQPELAFQSADLAIAFAFDALRSSRVYVSPEDRYAMQMLSELLGRAIRRGVISERDLWGTEPALISRLQENAECAADWARFCALHRMVWGEEAPESLRRVIPAKKRSIDPLVCGQGRASRIDEVFSRELQAFLKEDQSRWLCAE